MFETSKVCAIIVTNGLNNDLLKCVDSVVNQSFVPNQIYIVNVSDTNAELENVINSANAGLAQNNIETSFLLYSASGSVSFAQAVNKLIDSEFFNNENDYAWLLHNDSQADEGTLQALVNEMQLSETLGVVGSKQEQSDSGNLINVGYTTTLSGKRISLIGKEQVDQGQYSRIEDVFAVSLNGALIDAQTFKEVGGINEKIGLNDSLEYCRRVHLHGKRVIVSSGATIKHRQNSFSPDDLYKIRKAELLYRLSVVRIGFLPFLWIWLSFTNVLEAIKQLYSDNKGSAKVFSAGIVSLFSFASIFNIRSGLRKAKRVPRSVLRSFFATRKQVNLIRYDEKLERAANLWEDYQPTLLQADTLKSLAKKRRIAFCVTLLLLIGISIIHFSSYFGGLFLGGHFESNALTGSEFSFLQALGNALTGFSDINFGYNAPVNGIAIPLGFLAIIVGSVQNAINLFVLLSIILGGITAWIASGGATRNNSARIISALLWVSLPSFTSSLDEGRLGAILAHILLPLIPYLIARGLGKSSTDLNIGMPTLNYSFPLLGIVVAFSMMVSPVLILPLLIAGVLAGFVNRRFWFALIPAIVMNLILILWVLTNLTANSWQLLLGDIDTSKNGLNFDRRNVFQIIFGTGDITNANIIICFILIIVSALFLFRANRTARIILTRACWFVAVVALFLAIAFERNSMANATSLVSIAYLCFIITIIIFLNQRICFEKKDLIPYTLVGICVIILSISYIVFDASRDLRVASDYALPTIAAKISSEDGNPRTLVLDEDARGVVYSIIPSRTLDYVNNSDATQIMIDNTSISQKDEKLRKAIAEMLSAPNTNSLRTFEELGIKSLFVPAAKDDLFTAKHEKLLKSVDSTPGIIRIIEGNDRAFWRFPNLQEDADNVSWDNSKADSAYNNPLRYIYIFIYFITLFVFILLSLPFGKRKVVKYDV